MERFDNSCYINSMYTLLQFLLLKNKEEREKTFYFFGRAIPKNVAEHFENSWHLNTRFKDEKGLNKYIKIYLLYKNLEKFIIKEKLTEKIMYMQDNMSYSQFFLNHMQICYLLEDGIGNYQIAEEKSSKKKKKFKEMRDRFLKRCKKNYSTPVLCENIKKIYLTGIAETPEIMKNKAEIIDIREKWKKISLEEKEEILNIFGLSIEKFIILEKLENKILIITQPLSEDGALTEEEKIELYRNILKKYSDDNIIIKTHPREKTDYKQYFSKALIINEKFPLEIVALLNINFKEVVTIFSTAAFHFKGISNVKIEGTEKIGKLKKRFGETKETYYKI